MKTKTKDYMYVKMDKSILDYFYMMNDLDNEPDRDTFMKEFINELEKSINIIGKKKKILFIDKDGNGFDIKY